MLKGKIEMERITHIQNDPPADKNRFYVHDGFVFHYFIYLIKLKVLHVCLALFYHFININSFNIHNNLVNWVPLLFLYGR